MLSLSAAELEALAVLHARAREDAVLLGSVTMEDLVRFLLANSCRTPRAFRRLQQREMLRNTTWQWSSCPLERAEQAMDTIGYWQASGVDQLGRPTAFLVQREATDPKTFLDAVAGLIAAHRFFLATASDLALACYRQGLVLVIDLSRYRAARLLAPPSKHIVKLGDAYTSVMPIRVASILVVDVYHGHEFITKWCVGRG